VTELRAQGERGREQLDALQAEIDDGIAAAEDYAAATTDKPRALAQVNALRAAHGTLQLEREEAQSDRGPGIMAVLRAAAANAPWVRLSCASASYRPQATRTGSLPGTGSSRPCRCRQRRRRARLPRRRAHVVEAAAGENTGPASAAIRGRAQAHLRALRTTPSAAR
jgi:hypothetical protein